MYVIHKQKVQQATSWRDVGENKLNDNISSNKKGKYFQRNCFINSKYIMSEYQILTCSNKKAYKCSCKRNIPKYPSLFEPEHTPESCSSHGPKNRATELGSHLLSIFNAFELGAVICKDAHVGAI
jgi:hypothetical protein